MEKTFLVNQLKMIQKHMKTFKKLQLVKEMITQLFHKTYKMTAIDLSKQQALDADPKAILQINFTGNLSGTNNRSIFLIFEEAKETVLDSLQGTVTELRTCSPILFCFDIMLI